MKKAGDKELQEWFRQAQYDLKSSEVMFESRRYIHAIFMCHLSIEKALKGLYASILKEMPPKTHNLIYLVEKIKVELPDDLFSFLATMNGVSVLTRYPDELKKMQKVYNRAKAKVLLEKSKVLLKWLKAKT